MAKWHQTKIDLGSIGFWCLFSFQIFICYGNIYTLYIYIYIHTWLYAYTYGSCSKSYTTSECLKIFGFSVIYVTVYVYSFKMIHFFIHQQKLQLMDFGLIFGPGTASVSSYPPFKWCSVCFGKMMWTLVCVQRYVCLCELIYTTYVWCMYMIYIYTCVIWQTRRTFLMMMHIYLRMLICIFPSKKVKTMAEDLPHSVDVKEKTWSFRHRTRTADHRRKLTRSSGSTWIWWISSWVSYGTPSIGSDDAKTSEKKGQQKRHDVWRSAWASWRKRCIKNFERVFFWLCGS